jgi:hypothetical protein
MYVHADELKTAKAKSTSILTKTAKNGNVYLSIESVYSLVHQTSRLQEPGMVN